MPTLSKSLLHKLRVCLFNFLPFTPQYPDALYDNNWWSKKTTGNYAGKYEEYSSWGFNYNKDFDVGDGWNVYYQLNGGVLKNNLLSEEKEALLSFLDSVNTISISIVVQNMHNLKTGRTYSLTSQWQDGTYRLTPLDLGSVWAMMGAKGDTRLNRDNSLWGTASGTKSPGGTQVITQNTEPTQTEVLPAINTASGWDGPGITGHRAGWGFPSILNSDRSSNIIYDSSNDWGTQLPTTKVRRLADLPASYPYYTIQDRMNLFFDCGIPDTALASYSQKMIVVDSYSGSDKVASYQTHIDIPKADFINLINNGTTISGSLHFPIALYAKHKLNKNKSSLADSFNYTIALIFHDSGPGYNADFRPVHIVFDKLRVLDRWDVEHIPSTSNPAELLTALCWKHPVRHYWVPGINSNITWQASDKKLYVTLPGDWVYKNFVIGWQYSGWLASKKTDITFSVRLYNSTSAVEINPWSSASGIRIYVTSAATTTGVPPRDEKWTLRIDIDSSIDTSYAIPGLLFTE